jgi:hypothetical protein
VGSEYRVQQPQQAGKTAFAIILDLTQGASVKTKWVMIASASLLLAHGIVLLFASELLCKLFNLNHSPEGSVTAQLFGVALISLGLMNWTARRVVLGGIYGRALVYGNFVFSLIGFFVGIRARLNDFGNEYFWIEVVLYLAFAIVFGSMLFRGPFSHTTES